MPTVRAADLADPVPGVLADPADVALRDRGLGILGHRLHTLADLIVPSLYAAEPVYRGIPSGELQMARTVHEGLKACRFPPEDRADTTGWPREVGRRRVWRGVPLEAMHRAYHIFGQVLFSSFMRWADEEELPRERSVALADDLWHVVDLHCAAATNAFRATEDAASPPPSTVAETRPVAGTPDDGRSRIFLCHSRVDKETVRDLCRRLRDDRLDPWFDEEDLQPGQDWEFEIEQVIGKSRFVLVCLSGRSTTSRGFIHKEIKFALDVADLQPEGKVFIIPVRLEHCSIPDRLKRWHWVDLFESKGYRRLLRALRSESETPRLDRASRCMSIDA
jgi:hypothetical protein